MRNGLAWLTAVAALGVFRPAGAEILPTGPNFVVNTYTTDGQYHPSVCRFASGDFVVVWQGYDQDNGAVFGQRFGADGTRLGTEFQVNTYTTDHQDDPTICCDTTGFVVAWESAFQDGSNPGVFGQRFARDGTRLGTEFQTNTYTTGSQEDMSLCCDAAGGFVIAWDSPQDGSSTAVLARRYTSAGAPAGGEFQLNTYTTDDQRDVRVSCDPAGNFVAVWTSNTQDGASNGVFARRYASTGSPAGPEFQVNAYTTNDQNDAGVCRDAAGNFVVAWRSLSQDGDGPTIIARRYDSAGTALSSEFQVNTYTTSGQDGPSVSCSAAGDFVVAWESYTQDGSLDGIFAQRFDADGTRHGSEFRVNSYTTGNQYAPVVALDKDGDFVVVWASDGVDGSAFAVAAQRYQDPCGDGTLGAGEQCDDGDRTPGDCCSPTCQPIAAGTACADDGVACTADTCNASGQCHTPSPSACGACRQCDTSAGCVARPRTDCRHPTRARQAILKLVNESRDRSDRLSLELRKEAATTTADFGTPTTAPDYTLCLFDSAGGAARLVLMSRAPAGAGWKATGRKGFRYRMKSAAPDGLASAVLKSGGAGKAFVGVNGKGANLRLPALGLTTPVTAQLEAGAGGACFAGTFTTPQENTATLFKAKGN